MDEASPAIAATLALELPSPRESKRAEVSSARLSPLEVGISRANVAEIIGEAPSTSSVKSTSAELFTTPLPSASDEIRESTKTCYGCPAPF